MMLLLLLLLLLLHGLLHVRHVNVLSFRILLPQLLLLLL
jgi:hypothetical protein